MADLKSLSDEELRRKLKENGILSPVTASTRSILIKKLNHAIAGQKKQSNTKNSRNKTKEKIHSLNTLSSDEETDSGLPSTRLNRSSRKSRAERIRRPSEEDLFADEDRESSFRNDSCNGVLIGLRNNKNKSDLEDGPITPKSRSVVVPSLPRLLKSPQTR